METIQIELTRIFVKVIQHGSFTKAAEALNITKSSVSKSITKLEKIAGTKLLVRTTRSHTLTEAGQTFYEKCLAPIQIIEDAQKGLVGVDSIASGNIRITATEDFGTYLIAPVIGKLSAQYPELRFDLHFTDNLIDMVKSGFDIAVRIGTLKESGLKMRTIGRLNLVLVASPEYLKKAEKIKHPKDLSNHHCLSITDIAAKGAWELQSGEKKIEIPIKNKIEGNQMNSLLHASVAGAGVLLAPTFICQPEIESGRLVRVLDDWKSIGLTISLVSPISMQSTERLRVVTEALLPEIRDKL